MAFVSHSATEENSPKNEFYPLIILTSKVKTAAQ